MADDTIGEKSKSKDFEEEVADGQVDETEEEEHARAEVEGQHCIPRHDAPRFAEQFLAYLFGHVAGTAVLLAQSFDEFLELWRALLLLAGIVNVCLEEVLPESVALAGCLVVGLLLLLGAVQLATLLALEHEEMYLDVVVGHALLRSHADEARIERQGGDNGCGNQGVLLRVWNTQPSELQRVVLIEAEHEKDIDGDEPSEACHAIKDTTEAALLASQASQLTIRAIEDVCPAKQQDADNVEPKPVPTFIIEAAVQEEVATSRTDKHRSDGDCIGVDVELGEEHSQEITQWTHNTIVEPILCLWRLKCGKIFFLKVL